MGYKIAENLTRMTVFVICAQALSRLCPDKSYAKYYRFLVNLLILLWILVPARAYFMGDAGFGPEDRMMEIERLTESFWDELIKSEVERSGIGWTESEKEENVSMEEDLEPEETKQSNKSENALVERSENRIGNIVIEHNRITVGGENE